MKVPRHTIRRRQALLAAALAAACASSPPRAGEPAAETSASPTRTYSDADVRFMQGMIHHHAQAIEMAALVEERTGAEAVRRMARRIDISQRDEIARMQRWLTRRGEEAPREGEHGDHEHGPGELMPGMLTPEQMEELAAARGTAFDRLFLERMIQHHEGALVMVRDLLSQGGGQEPEIFAFTSDVDADQRAEIARMRDLLDSQPRGGME